MKRIYTWGAVVIVVAGAVTGIVLAQKSGNKQKVALNALAAEAGCSPLENPKELPRGHVQRPTKVQYSSTPPTSGQHWADTGAPAQTGVWTSPIENEEQVHNLEHGHIVVQYNGISDSLTTKLENFTKTDSTHIIVAPYPSMTPKIAMTAWGHLIGCSNPNDKVVDLAKQFYDTYKGKAPEGDIPGRAKS